MYEKYGFPSRPPLFYPPSFLQNLERIVQTIIRDATKLLQF